MPVEPLVAETACYGFAAGWPRSGINVLTTHVAIGRLFSMYTRNKVMQNDHEILARPPNVLSTPRSGQGDGPTPSPVVAPTTAPTAETSPAPTPDETETTSADEESDEDKWLDAAWEVAVTVIGAAVVAAGAGCVACACRRTRSLPMPFRRPSANDGRDDFSAAAVGRATKQEEVPYYS